MKRLFLFLVTGFLVSYSSTTWADSHAPIIVHEDVVIYETYELLTDRVWKDQDMLGANAPWRPVQCLMIDVEVGDWVHAKGYINVKNNGPRNLEKKFDDSRAQRLEPEYRLDVSVSCDPGDSIFRMHWGYGEGYMRQLGSFAELWSSGDWVSDRGGHVCIVQSVRAYDYASPKLRGYLWTDTKDKLWIRGEWWDGSSWLRAYVR